MAKQVLVDQNAVDEALRVTKEFGFGLVLGQAHEGDKDVVFRFVPTPAAPKAKGKGKAQSVQFDTAWTVEHAVQIRRISPGGVNIIGMYAITTSKTFPTNLEMMSSSLRQVCTDSSDVSRKSAHDPAKNSGHQILLNLCPYSKTVTGKLFEENEPKGRPVEIKSQQIVSKLCLFESSIEIDYLVPLTIESSKTVFQQMLHGMTPLFVGIRSSTASIDGRLIVSDEEIASGSMEKKTKGRKEEKTVEQPTRYVELLSSTEGILDGEQLNLSKAEWSMRIQGSIRGFALAQGKESYGSALHYIKEDLVKSIRTRLELVAQGAEDESGQNPFMKKVADDPTVLRSFLDVGADPLPKRVLFRQQDSILFFDYAVESETKQDVYARMQELIGIQAPLEELEIEDVEDAPEGGNVMLQPLQSHEDEHHHNDENEGGDSQTKLPGDIPALESEKQSSVQTVSPPKESQSSQAPLLLISLVVLLVAVAFALTR